MTARVRKGRPSSGLLLSRRRLRVCEAFSALLQPGPRSAPGWPIAHFCIAQFIRNSCTPVLRCGFTKRQISPAPIHGRPPNQQLRSRTVSQCRLQLARAVPIRRVFGLLCSLIWWQPSKVVRPGRRGGSSVSAQAARQRPKLRHSGPLRSSDKLPRFPPATPVQ